MPKLFYASLIVVVAVQACQPPLREDESLLENMMKRQPRQFQYFLDHKDSLEIQIIYTQINRDANNRPKFRSFYFNVDSTRYFYPASTVKFPVLLLALEKLHRLDIPGLDMFTPMLTDSVYSGQQSVKEDTTSPTCLPSVAQYAKKILVVSDNDAFNRLYEFMGQQATNQNLAKKGYTLRILHRLERGLTPDENRHTEAIRFVEGDKVVYRQPMLVGDSIRVHQSVCKGIGFMRDDSLIREPFDFTYKNFFPLTEQQHVLIALLFPDAVNAKKTFDISCKDRKFILQYMSQLPTETFFPPYAGDTAYYPAYCKYLMFGNDRNCIPDNLRIFNKVGEAYGYLIDNAYIVDFRNNVEFVLSAVIATNTDQVYNDNAYDLEKLGYPFMKDVGQMVYDYELSRKRAHPPNLDGFKLPYDVAPD